MPEEKRQQLGDIGRSAMTQGISCQQQEAMDGLKTPAAAPPHSDVLSVQWLGRIQDVAASRRRVCRLRWPR